MGEGYSKDHWKRDAEVKHCKRCAGNFSLSNRRHHCRNCGDIFCGSCAFRVESVPERSIKDPVRVCDDCYAALLKARSKGTAGAGAGGAGRANSNNAAAAGGGAGGGGQGRAASQQQHPNSGGNAAGGGGGGGGDGRPAPAFNGGASGGGTGPGAPVGAATPAAGTPAAAAAAERTTEDVEREIIAARLGEIRNNTRYVDVDAAIVGPLDDDQTIEWADTEALHIKAAAADAPALPFPAAVEAATWTLVGALMGPLETGTPRDWAAVLKAVGSAISPVAPEP